MAGGKALLDTGLAAGRDPQPGARHLAVLVDQVDHAEVRELGDEDVADRLDRLLEAAAGVRDARRFAQHPIAAPCLALTAEQDPQGGPERDQREHNRNGLHDSPQLRNLDSVRRYLIASMTDTDQMSKLGSGC